MNDETVRKMTSLKSEPFVQLVWNVLQLYWLLV